MKILTMQFLVLALTIDKYCTKNKKARESTMDIECQQLIFLASAYEGQRLQSVMYIKAELTTYEVKQNPRKMSSPGRDFDPPQKQPKLIGPYCRIYVNYRNHNANAHTRTYPHVGRTPTRLNRLRNKILCFLIRHLFAIRYFPETFADLFVSGSLVSYHSSHHFVSGLLAVYFKR